jgi:hypothetical protein
MAADDSTMLLDYAFSTDPAPIQISTAQVTSQSRVNIGISAGIPVYCNQISVAVPVGPDADRLYAQPPAGSTNTKKWALTTTQQKGGELWPGLDADKDYTTFTYDCHEETDRLIDYNLVFGVFGAVNSEIGDLEIRIQEKSGTTPDPSTFTAKAGSFTLRKDRPEFYLTNLVATTPDSPTAPCTDFANGAPIRLAWESNGTYFQLFVKGQTAPIYAGTATTFTLSGGISRGTTFVLAASMTGSPGQDIPQGGYQPIYLYDSLAVSVSNPVLTPTSVDVSGSLGVAGASTLNGATVNGTLTGTGSASLNNLVASGGFRAYGRVSLLSAPTLVNQGPTLPQTAVFAITDGFAVAKVVQEPGGITNRVSSFAWGSINVQGTREWFHVTGGLAMHPDSPNKQFGMAMNPNTITVPIPASSTWFYKASNLADNSTQTVIQIWWFPIGGIAAPQSFRTLSAEELAATPPPPPAPDFHAMVADQDAAATTAATDFVDRLAKAMKTTLSDESRSDLVQSLRQL